MVHVNRLKVKTPQTYDINLPFSLPNNREYMAKIESRLHQQHERPRENRENVFENERLMATYFWFNDHGLKPVKDKILLRI